MKKIINVVYPPITSFPHYAGPLSLIYNYDNAKTWFYNSYIQLYTDFRHIDRGEIKFRQEFLNFPFINICGIEDYRLLFGKDNLIFNLKNIINENIAVATNLDRYFITSYKQQEHLIHPAYFYGYDDDNQLFYISDFVSSGKFIFTDISYKSFMESVYIMDDLDYKFKNSSKKYFLSLYYINDREYNFSINKLYKELLDYYNCQNTIDSDDIKMFYKLTDDVKWGLAVYDWFMEYISEFGKTDYCESTIDHRIAYIINDHKKAMLLRLEYMQDKKYITNGDNLIKDYNDLYINSNILLNLCLKYNSNHSNNTIERML
jgi:hypothetical protein